MPCADRAMECRPGRGRHEARSSPAQQGAVQGAPGAPPTLTHPWCPSARRRRPPPRTRPGSARRMAITVVQPDTGHAQARGRPGREAGILMVRAVVRDHHDVVGHGRRRRDQPTLTLRLDVPGTSAEKPSDHRSSVTTLPLLASSSPPRNPTGGQGRWPLPEATARQRPPPPAPALRHRQ